MQLGPVFVITGLFYGLIVFSALFYFVMQILKCRAQGLRALAIDIDAVNLMWQSVDFLTAVAFFRRRLGDRITG
mgnify:CR=1 FL=1|tara:strand:+ start:141 stop:362 length:222 start_codon:yes stop_codon:yes gene_type:complete